MSLKAALSAIALLAAASIASAQSIAPDDWTAATNGAIRTFAAPNGVENIALLPAPAGLTPEQAAESAARAVTRSAKDSDVKIERQAVDGPLSIYRFNMLVGGQTITGEAFGLEQSDSKAIAVVHMAKQGTSGFAARLRETRAKAKALAAATEPSTPNRARMVISPPPEPLSAPQAGTYAQADVLHYLFDLSYTYGVGGMPVANYQPVAIFKDGAAVRLEGMAVEDVSIAALKRTDPGRVGTWRKSGQVYKVRYADGETEDLKPTIGPAFPWPSGEAKLQGTYKSIGGGGNTAIGGGTMTFQVKDLTFFADGSFSQSNFRGGTTPNTTNTVKTGTAGRWRLDGSTLTLAYQNGQTYRTPLLISGKKGQRGGVKQLRVLWIGGEDYRRKD